MAGLAAAIRLLELGCTPLLIEGGGYPAHKVCGEFLSPCCLPVLHRWGIYPLPITMLNWCSRNQSISFPLPEEASSLSHLTLDVELANHMTQLGGVLLTHTKVVELIPAGQIGNDHLLVLSSGEQVKAHHLLIATGRLPGRHEVRSPRYIGLKAHFSGLHLDSSLHMFSVKGAYLGMVPVENGLANVACLASIDEVKKYPSASHFMQHLIAAHAPLQEVMTSAINCFDGWMEAMIPPFGWHALPNWPRTYWMGDALGSFPPASGNGLAFALASGRFSAECAAQTPDLLTRKKWRYRCTLAMSLAKGLHCLFLNPSYSERAITCAHVLPRVAQQVFSLTRL